MKLYSVSFEFGPSYDPANSKGIDRVKSISFRVNGNNQFDAQAKAWAMVSSLNLDEPTRVSASVASQE